MARKVSNRLEDLNLSRDEVTRLGEALKKKEFRDLLFEYAREVSDPVNKKQYEDEITQLENERGVDIKFVHPEPQYVIKTCFNPGGGKVFVNICSNSLVGKPTSRRNVDANGAGGVNWSIPILQAPPREDLDKSGILCTVYDVVFHPDTHVLAAKDRRFRSFVEETALNAVEESYAVKLDRNSIKRPRMKFKGLPQPTVIRTRRPKEATDKDDDSFISQFPYPYDMPPKEALVRELKEVKMESKVENKPKESYITPIYTIKQSSDVDMADFEQNLLSHHGITVPQRLVLIVDLPYIKSSSDIELDLEAQKVTLVSKGKKSYKLDLKLPYPIQETKGNAKFDKEAGKLLVTMIVDRQKAILKKIPEGDSGIESDMGCGRTSSGEEEEIKASEEDSSSVPMSLVEEDNANRKRSGDDGLICEHGLSVSDGKNSFTVTCGEKNMMFETDLQKELIIDESKGDDMDNCLKFIENEGEVKADSVNIPKVQIIQNINDNAMIKSKEKSKSFSLVKFEESTDVMNDLLLPGISYLMPSYSCNCLHEEGCASIIFVLNAKNVDPSSLNKKIKYLSAILKNEQDVQVNSLVSEVSSGIGSLASENGSVCNEYRTVGNNVSSASANSSNLSDTTITSDNCSGNEYVQLSRPANVCTNEVNPSCNPSSIDIGNKCDSKPVSNNLIKNTSKDVSSQFLANLASNDAEVPGANLLTVEGTKVDDDDGKGLSDILKNCLLIKEEESAEMSKEEREFFCYSTQKLICFHMTFTSIGAGYFPQHYSFSVSFLASQWPNIDPESLDCCPISVEIWDNNVEVQWKKACSRNDIQGVLSCFVGQDPGKLSSFQLPPFENNEAESETYSEPDFSSLTSVSEDQKDEEVNKQSDNCGARKDNKEDVNGEPKTIDQRRKMFKERTLSESSVESNGSKQVTKGILKRRGRASLGRSLSESSGGEEYSWVAAAPHLSFSSSSSPSFSEVNRFTLGESLKEEEEGYDEEEDDDEEDGEKVKKIVRFSDVISQKTFRSNSSILGQRKKNQRKTRNKKRAAERRASESENSVDEGDMGTNKSNSDSISDSSPPQKTEILMPADQSSVKGKAKGASKKKGGGNKGKAKKGDVLQKSDDSSSNPSTPQYEFKSDLIFQLEL